MAEESLPLFPFLARWDREKPVFVLCLVCKQVFQQTPDNTRYCSRKCYARSGVEHTTRYCVICTAPFHPKKRTQICCSMKCQQRHMRSGPMREVLCKQCGTGFLAVKRQVMFCSDVCRNTGKNAWTPERKAYQQSIREIRNEQQRQRLAKMSRAQKLLPGFNSRYKACLRLDELELMLMEQENTCALCGDLLDKWEIDHIVARGNGGLSTSENLQLVCRPCNVGKWTMTVDDYIAHCTKVADFQRKARAAGADIPEKPKRKGSRSSY